MNTHTPSTDMNWSPHQAIVQDSHACGCLNLDLLFACTFKISLGSYVLVIISYREEAGEQ